MSYMAISDEFQVTTNGRNLAVFDNYEDAVDEYTYRKNQNIPNSTVSVYNAEGEELMYTQFNSQGEEITDDEEVLLYA